MSKTFIQANYGTVRGISMAASGCGPSSVASIVYNSDPTITPREVAEWMASKGYFMSSGSTRLGITYTLEHYGFEVTHYLKDEHRGGSCHSTFCEEMKKSRGEEVWGIILAVGTSDGAKDNFWTSGGHFLSITDYDPSTGKYYVRDSGAKRHTGYYSPDAFKRDVNVYYVIRKKKNVGKVCELKEILNRAFGSNLVVTEMWDDASQRCVNNHAAKRGDKNDFVLWIQTALSKVGFSLVPDKSFGPATESNVQAFQKKYGLVVDGKVGNQTVTKLLELI